MPSRTPNFLFINVDQHRYDSMGHTSAGRVKTPNLDRLAESGMRFEKAFTPIPLCCPARQSLLCSQTPERHGGVTNYRSGQAVALFEPDRPLWTTALAEAGYRNAYLGKWHVHPDRTPLEYGFHEYVPENRFPYLRGGTLDWSDPRKIAALGAVDPGPLEGSWTHRMADACIQTLKPMLETGKPWHVRLDFPHPHLPCIPSEPFASMYQAKDLEPWGSFKDAFKNKPYIQKQQLRNWEMEDWGWKQWSQYVAQYFAVISQVDDAVGRVLSFLEEAGAMGETMAIYTADHGDMAGSHRMMDKHYVMYDDIVRVPLLVRWDGKIKAGSVDRGFTSHYLDLGPTALEAAGLPIPDTFQGASLLARMTGRGGKAAASVVSTYHGQQFGLYSQRMIRDRRYKLVWNLTDVDEFYDLQDDPWELKNLAVGKAHAALVARYQKKLFAELTRLKDPILSESAWMRRQLGTPGRKLERAAR